MKSFKVPIKNVHEDFIVTSNVWLTLNCPANDHYLFKKDNKNELLFGACGNQSLAASLQELPSGNLASAFNDAVQHPNGISLFYINSTDGIIRFRNKPEIQSVLFRLKTSDYLVLNEDGNAQKFGDGDALIGFFGKLSTNELDKLKDIVLGNGHICYKLLNDITAFLSSYHSDVFPVFLVNFTEHASYSFPIKSSLKTVSLTIDMIKNKLVKHDLEKIWQVETVLHEALVNAITYGSDLDNSKNVDISYEMGKKGLRVVISDKGTGFDVNNITVPVGLEALEKVNGRGIYIMQKFSDELFFNEKGNELILFFNF